MFPNDTDFKAFNQRYEELLIEAEQRRLARAIELAEPSKPGSLQRIAVWVGGRLVQFGGTLQRYGAVQPLQIAGNRVERVTSE